MHDDLGENKQRLFAVASKAQPGDRLVDLGVRWGASSLTMLEATSDQQCTVIGVDVQPYAFEAPARYEYLQTDSIKAAPLITAPLYLVFIDTLHIKEQVMAELCHYWPKIRVGGYAVIHDTSWPEEKRDEYLGIVWEHAVDGVNDFFSCLELGVDYEREDHPESWGMTFIKKLSPKNPCVPGMDRALVASQKLTRYILSTLK